MLGAEYTPQEFAHSVCYPEEYVSLTSFSHHPYREYFALEVPDNRMHDAYLNLPLDELMLHIQEGSRKRAPGMLGRRHQRTWLQGTKEELCRHTADGTPRDPSFATEGV